MGKLFTLTPDILQIAQDGIDDLIDQLGKTCRLVLAPHMLPCQNCEFDPVGNKSANRWVNGGPVPFDRGTICPVCDGQGYRAEEQHEDITMLVAMKPQDFYKKIPFNIQVPEGVIQTKGYMTDLPKIRRAQRMILQPELESVARWAYELDGDPVDMGNIIQKRYVVAQWRRVV